MLPHLGLVLYSSSEPETPGDLSPMPHAQCLKQKDVCSKREGGPYDCLILFLYSRQTLVLTLIRVSSWEKVTKMSIK